MPAPPSSSSSSRREQQGDCDPDNLSLLEAAIAKQLKDKNPQTKRAARPRTHREKQQTGRGAASERAKVEGGTRSIIGRTVGPFRLTPKQPDQKSGGQYGGWEVFCPFHRKNFKSGCRKWFPLLGPNLQHKQEAAAAALEWCAAARRFDRQWLHLAFAVDYAAAAPVSTTRLLPIFMEAPPKIRCAPDTELDGVDGAAAAAPRRAQPKRAPSDLQEEPSDREKKRAKGQAVRQPAHENSPAHSTADSGSSDGSSSSSSESDSSDSDSS